MDSAVVETFKMLPDVTNSLLTCEIQEYVSSMLVNKAVDSARHVVMLEKQVNYAKHLVKDTALYLLGLRSYLVMETVTYCGLIFSPVFAT